MARSLASIIAAVRRGLHMSRAIFFPSNQAFEPSRSEHLETIFKVAGQSLGECPTWVLIAIEQSERHDAYVSDVQERKLLC